MVPSSAPKLVLVRNAFSFVASLAVITISGLLSAPVVAQVPMRFEKAVAYPTAAFEPLGVAVTDLNNDGKQDLVVANWCKPTANCVLYGTAEIGELSVLRGNGDGTFQPAEVYDTGGYFASAVAVADLNGDGHPDVIVTNYCKDPVCWEDGSVAVRMGTSNGRLRWLEAYDSGGQGPQSIAIGDVNGDGIPDIVVANAISATIGVLLGKGDGTFHHVISFGTPGAMAAVTADVNGDGKAEIVAAMGGLIGVYGCAADGTCQLISFSGSGADSESITTADVNGDGKADIITANLSGSVSVLLGNGDGTLQPAVVYRSGGYFSYSIAVADVNGDDIPDLIVTNAYRSSARDQGGVAVLLGKGNGTFEPPVSYKTGGAFACSAAIGDFNGDGKADLVVANGGSDSVGALLNNSGYATSLELASSMNPSLHNKSITLTATLTSTRSIPDGEMVAFYDRGAVLGSTSITNGMATLTTSSLSLGIHSIKATYAGDRNHQRSSTAINQAVSGYTTTSTLASSLSPSIYGQSVTFTATVSTSGSLAPSGAVIFSWSDGFRTYAIGSATLNGTGAATLTTPYLNAGSYPMTALYRGDADNGSSISAVVNQTVLPATTAATITSSPNPSAPAQAVTFTAKITSPTVVPKGPVTFTAGATVLGTAQLSWGKATYTTSSLPAGSNGIKVIYNGDSNIAGSSAGMTQVVQP